MGPPLKCWICDICHPSVKYVTPQSSHRLRNTTTAKLSQLELLVAHKFQPSMRLMFKEKQNIFSRFIISWDWDSGRKNKDRLSYRVNTMTAATWRCEKPEHHIHTHTQTQTWYFFVRNMCMPCSRPFSSIMQVFTYVFHISLNISFRI